MILARISQHLRRQDWTAIGIEFLIVVLGVFIGTKVSDWHATRAERLRAQQYTERLLGDLRLEYAYTFSLRDYVVSTRRASEAAFAGLTRTRAMDDRTILIEAFRATQFQWYEPRRAAFDELVSAGELGLISDDHLREIAIHFYGQSDTVFRQTLDTGTSSEYRRMFFRVVDPGVEAALRADCGDRAIALPGSSAGAFTIDYDCELSLDEATVQRAVAALRAEPGILPALRHQYATFDTMNFNYEYIIEATGIQTLFPAPASNPAKPGS